MVPLRINRHAGEELSAGSRVGWGWREKREPLKVKKAQEGLAMGLRFQSVVREAA